MWVIISQQAVNTVVSSRLYGHFGGETSAIQPQKFHTDSIDLSRIW